LAEYHARANPFDWSNGFTTSRASAGSEFIFAVAGISTHIPRVHSSPLLFAPEFRATRRGSASGELEPASLADIFPDYHDQDRVAVVANTWEESFLRNAAGITALTALFYDAQRATGKSFYTYPSHYLLLCEDPQGVATRTGRRHLSTEEAGRPWSNVDVWPETQWLRVAPDAISLLRMVFAQHIHRLFWPRDLPVTAFGQLLPGYMRLIIESRLKAVYFYNSSEPNLQIEASPKARELLGLSPKYFPTAVTPPTESWYRVEPKEKFMQLVAGCFEKTPASEPD
jgi:hypothetical protein